MAGRLSRAVAAQALALGGLALIVAGSFQPWLRSGDRTRSSYELFHVAGRLGFLGDGPARWLPRAWVFVPLLAAVAFAGAVVRRWRLEAAISAVVGAAGLVIAGGVLAAPVATERGAWIGAVGSVFALVGATAIVLIHRSRKSETSND